MIPQASPGAPPVTDYASEEQDPLCLFIRALWMTTVVWVVGLLTYWTLADPLLELARHAIRRHPAIQALADAEDAIQRAIAAHDAQRARSDWDDHDKTVDNDLHRRLGEVVELQKAVAAKLATVPEKTPERLP
jgi:hypothetical protein